MRMKFPVGALVVAAALGLTADFAVAKNEVQKECAAKYQAAKAANQLNGLTYNQFSSKCAAEVRAEKEKPAATTTPAATTAAKPAPAPAPTTAAKPAPAPTTTAAKPAPAPAPKAAPPATQGAAVFPTAISPEFSKLKPGDGRRKTCSAQYQANKATNGNGGLPWTPKKGEKGSPSYYSECNKRLKG